MSPHFEEESFLSIERKTQRLLLDLRFCLYSVVMIATAATPATAATASKTESIVPIINKFET